MSNKLVSFAITAYNEAEYLDNLLSYIYTYFDEYYEDGKYEVIVQLDSEKATDDVRSITNKHRQIFGEKKYAFICEDEQFDKNFAQFKNCLNHKCSGNWIFNIDADEIPSAELMRDISDILIQNQYADVIAIPRKNYVDGITQDDILKWGWKIDESNLINWPDYQMRIYKNTSKIYWTGNVHERLIGHSTITAFPHEKHNAIYFLNHVKNIERQREQNKLYEVLSVV
ncbi:glyco_tranf_GTA_type domain containing protein [Microcystis phage Mel-JY01]